MSCHKESEDQVFGTRTKSVPAGKSDQEDQDEVETSWIQFHRCHRGRKAVQGPHVCKTARGGEVRAVLRLLPPPENRSGEAPPTNDLHCPQKQSYSTAKLITSCLRDAGAQPYLLWDRTDFFGCDMDLTSTTYPYPDLRSWTRRFKRYSPKRTK